MTNDSDGDGDSGNVRLAFSNDVLNDQADLEIISLPQSLSLTRKQVKNKEPSFPEVDGPLPIIVCIIPTIAAGNIHLHVLYRNFPPAIFFIVVFQYELLKPFFAVITAIRGSSSSTLERAHNSKYFHS
jgi:hypothetical protein